MGPTVSGGAEFERWLLAQAPAESSAVAPSTAPLTVSGVELRQGGAIWKARLVTAFRWPELYALGERTWIDEYSGACLALGANGLRWFAMWANTDYSPLFRPNYYDELEAALGHAKALGLFVHLVAFCDQVPGSKVWMQTSEGAHDTAAQDAHLRKVIEIAKRSGNVLLEVNNEDWKNGEISARFPAEWFAGTLSTRSSPPETDPPSDPEIVGSWLQWATKHLDRTFDWARKGKWLYEAEFEGLGAFPAPRIPAISGEPQRIGDGTTPRCHADNAAVCEIMGAGGCLHGGYQSFDADHDSDLQNCRMTGSANAMACAQAVGAVWKSSVLDLACGGTEKLVRGTEFDDGECPVHHRDRYNKDSPHNEPETGANRTYFKFLEGGARACGLSVDPAPKWAGYQTRNAWRIVNQGGFEGNLLELGR